MRGISKTITGARAVSVRAFHTSRAPMAIYNRITDTIGNTPIVKINNLAPEGVDVYAKLEYFNPLSSVKDRLALGVIDAAERSGALKPGMTVVEATSGNTGVATAMVCAERGYPCVIVMAESFRSMHPHTHTAYAWCPYTYPTPRLLIVIQLSRSKHIIQHASSAPDPTTRRTTPPTPTASSVAR